MMCIHLPFISSAGHYPNDTLDNLRALPRLGARVAALTCRAYGTVQEADVAKLTALTHLECPSHFPWSLAHLQQLKRLELAVDDLGFEGNPLQPLSALTCLTIDACERNQGGEAADEPVGGWQPLQHFTNLCELRLLDCLGDIPAALSSLTSLTLLELQNYSFVGGWHYLHPLQQLRHLAASGFEESSVPMVSGWLWALVRCAHYPIIHLLTSSHLAQTPPVRN